MKILPQSLEASAGGTATAAVGVAMVGGFLVLVAHADGQRKAGAVG